MTGARHQRDRSIRSRCSIAVRIALTVMFIIVFSKHHPSRDLLGTLSANPTKSDSIYHVWRDFYESPYYSRA